MEYIVKEDNGYFWCFDCRQNGAIGKLIPTESEADWHMQHFGHAVKKLEPVVDREFGAIKSLH